MLFNRPNHHFPKQRPYSSGDCKNIKLPLVFSNHEQVF